MKDAYSGLKTLLQRQFQGKPAAETALAEAVAEDGSDEEVMALAQQLPQLLQSQQPASIPQIQCGGGFR